MFNKKTDFNLDKYKEIRKNKMSIFNVSIEFDWLIVKIIFLILIIFIFFFYIKEIQYTINFDPEIKEAEENLQKEEESLKKLEEKIVELENNLPKEDALENPETIDEEVSE